MKKNIDKFFTLVDKVSRYALREAFIYKTLVH